MIRINSLKVNLTAKEEDIHRAILQRLHIKGRDLIAYKPAKISIDARKKDNIVYVYSIDCKVTNEEKILKDHSVRDIVRIAPIEYIDPFNELSLNDHERLYYSSSKSGRPVVIGFGPAGMISAYKLAAAGLKPIVIERGSAIEQRIKDVNEFWDTGKLNTSSNVQFGEGGAGTFSDGKLNTMIHDEYGRIREVFRIFIENGADESIMYTAKPHIGTDKLTELVKNIRNSIISHGGEIRFNTAMTEIITDNGHLKGIKLSDGNTIYTDTAILAIGHSARDTFTYLHKYNIPMEPKPFAVGVRMQHDQEMISRSQYGESYKLLPPADYKLTYKSTNGHGVYSFCMCPGGFVVNASSEEGMLVVNGMSNSDRSERSANSAIVVTVDPSEFEGEDVLKGMEFQRKLERSAYEACSGRIPVQYYDDFTCKKTGSVRPSNIPNTKGAYSFTDLNRILPEFISEPIKEAMSSFGKSIAGFDNDDTLLLGVETRTSSPVRILRDESFQSPKIKGLYPCGEGAGYAGGITSAAADGLKVYEAIIHKFITSEEI